MAWYSSVGAKLKIASDRCISAPTWIGVVCILICANSARSEKILIIPGYDPENELEMVLEGGECAPESEMSLQSAAGSVPITCKKAVISRKRIPSKDGEVTILVWDGVHVDQSWAIIGNFIDRNLIRITWAYPIPGNSVQASGMCQLTNGVPTTSWIGIPGEDDKLDNVVSFSCTPRDIKNKLQIFHFHFDRKDSVKSKSRHLRSKIEYTILKGAVD